MFALSGLRAGGVAPEVLAGSLCFAWLLAPCIALGTRPGSAAFRGWLGAPIRPRGLLAAIIAFAGVAAYVFAARHLDPRALAGLTVHSAVMLGIFEAVLLVVVVVAPVPGLGYSFRIGAGDLRLAAAAYLAFAVIAIPLGLALGFLRYHGLPFDALAVARRAFGFVFLVALPEELVFRGFVQNALGRRLFPGRPLPALAIASMLFGASHLGHPPVPNWRYGVLATLAGLAYGWVWHRTGKITASALLHAAVDLTWVWLLGGP